MKKYLFSFFAIAIALVAFSFTLPKKSVRTTYDFTFIGNPSSSLSQVEDEQTYWRLKVVEDDCGDIANDKACQLLTIPADYTEEVGGVRKLKTTVSIVAAVSGSTKYVASVNSLIIGETIVNSDVQ